MSKIYLPVEINDNMCAYVYDKDTIRVYDEIPRVNSTIIYTDYFINSNYLYRTGSTTFGQWSTISYNCLDSSLFSTNNFDRNDLDKILIITAILIFVCYYLIRTLVRRVMYGRKIF